MNIGKYYLSTIRRWWPLFLLAIVIAIAYSLGISDYLSIEKLREYRHAMLSWVHEHPVLAPITYMAVYYLLTIILYPDAFTPTLLAGFLFPQPYATIYVVISATLGAITTFFVAKTTIGAYFRQRAGDRFHRLKMAFEGNNVAFLLFLRWISILPFWLVNLAPAFFEVSLFTFTWTTIVGIIPASFIFTQAGSAFGEMLDSNKPFVIGSLFNAQMKIALGGLILFSFAMLVTYIVWKRRSSPK